MQSRFTSTAHTDVELEVTRYPDGSLSLQSGKHVFSMSPDDALVLAMNALGAPADMEGPLAASTTGEGVDTLVEAAREHLYAALIVRNQPTELERLREENAELTRRLITIAQQIGGGGTDDQCGACS